MKTLSAKTGLCLLLLSLGWSACTKTAQGIVGPSGPKGASGDSGLVVASAITGYVNLVNQYGMDTTPTSGVTVYTMKGDTLVEDTTDAKGWFSLPGLTKGGYILHFQKPGLDSLNQYVVHSGGPEDKFLGNIWMNESLTTTMFSFNSYISNPFPGDLSLYAYFYFSGQLVSDSTRRYFQVYMSHAKNVNRFFYDIEQDISGYQFATNEAAFSVDLTPKVVNGNAYNPGDTVYTKIYVVPPSSQNTSWYDVLTGVYVPYPYVGDSILSYYIW